MVAILNSGNQPTSGNVGSVRNVCSMVANVEITVSPARCVHYSFSLPVSVTVILNSVVDEQSKNAGQCRQCHMHVGPFENLRVAVDIASSAYAVQQLLALLPFLRPPSWISGRRRRWIFSTIAPLISPYPKMGMGLTPDSCL